MYDQLRELRADGNKAVKQTMLDAVAMLKQVVTGIEAVVTDVTESTDKAEDLF